MLSLVQGHTASKLHSPKNLPTFDTEVYAPCLPPALGSELLVGRSCHYICSSPCLAEAPPEMLAPELAHSVPPAPPSLSPHTSPAHHIPEGLCLPDLPASSSGPSAQLPGC